MATSPTFTINAGELRAAVRRALDATFKIPARLGPRKIQVWKSGDHWFVWCPCCAHRERSETFEQAAQLRDTCVSLHEDRGHCLRRD